jgi:glutathione S-transferase
LLLQLDVTFDTHDAIGLEQIMSVLRVLGRQSSINVRKVLWTCEEIGMDYVQEDWGTGFASTRTPEFRALNPNGLMPVIDKR